MHGVMLRGSCEAGVEFVRHWILEIQHNTKRPGGVVAAKIGAWVDVARGTCGVGTDFAGLVLWAQASEKCPGAGCRSKSVHGMMRRGAHAGWVPILRGQSLGIQPGKKCPGAGGGQTRCMG